MASQHPITWFDGYRTTYNKQVIMKDIIDKITGSMVYGHMNEDVSELGLLGHISLITARNNQVPILSHPVIYSNGIEHSPKVYIDVRAVSRIDPHEEKLRITNESAFNFIRWRANLTMYSLVKSKSEIWDAANFTSAIYASWISEALSKRFLLDLSVGAKILIIAAVFYNVQFNGVEILSTEDRCQKLAVATTRRLSRLVNDPSMVKSVIDELSELPHIRSFSTLDDLAYAIRELSGCVRLLNLSTKQIMEATGYGWYGADGILLCATALEDPATFITLCVIGHENPNYHKTNIGMIVKRRASEMSNNIEGLVNEIKTIPQ